MGIDQNSLITLVAIFSVTLVITIGLTRNTDTKLDLKLGDDKSLTIEGKRPPPRQTEISCMSGEENSQLLDCDS